MARAKQTKLPAVRVPSDDFVVSAGGTEYRPHAGEWLELRPGASVGDMLVTLRLQHLQGLEGLTVEDLDAERTAELEKALLDVIAFLQQRITCWNWTDNAGEPYSARPDSETLRSLSYEELAYLLECAFGGQVTEGNRKNGSSPST